jgi:hypothetical protein
VVANDKYSDITVVAIYGDGRGRIALPALKKTAAALPGSKQLLVTNVAVDADVPQKLTAHSLDYHAYSEFVLYGLHHYIDTPYALIVQHDGWALNPDNWRDEWLTYDYVGGLTHAALTPYGLYKTMYTWWGESDIRTVQNGGFSLRSKAMLEAPSKYGIMRNQQAEPMLMNEDVQVCCFMRPALENVGIQFCPDELSKYFSFEHLGPPHEGMDLTKVFGHHARFRQLLDNDKVLWKLTKEQMEGIQGEEAVYDLFSDYYKYEMLMA